MTTSITVIPRSVEIRVADGSAETVHRTLRNLLATHDLVLIRGAAVSDDELRRIGESLGQGCSDIKKFVTQGPTGPAGQSRWHHVGNLAGNKAADATLMVIREFPTYGGEFELVSNRLAWRKLSPAQQSRLRPLQVEHDFTSVRHTTANADDPSRKGVLPLVADGGGDPHLMLGFHAARINGMDETASRSLLDQLLSAATQETCVYRHYWQQGDLVAWRNNPLMHRSCGFDVAERRAIHEVTIRELEI